MLIGVAALISAAETGGPPGPGGMGQTPTTETTPPSIGITPVDADRALGSPRAPVTVVEYASMTCDHCVAKRYEIVGTPTFLINGHVIRGALTYPQITQLIEGANSHAVSSATKH